MGGGEGVEMENGGVMRGSWSSGADRGEAGHSLCVPYVRYLTYLGLSRDPADLPLLSITTTTQPTWQLITVFAFDEPHITIDREAFQSMEY